MKESDESADKVFGWVWSRVSNSGFDIVDTNTHSLVERVGGGDFVFLGSGFGASNFGS